MEISEIFFQKTWFLKSKMIFSKVFESVKNTQEMTITYFLGFIKPIFSPTRSIGADLGIIYGSFEPCGLPNAYFTTEKHLSMIKTRLISRPLKQNGVRRFFSASYWHYLKTSVAFSIGHRPMMWVFKTISNTRGVEPTSYNVRVGRRAKTAYSISF